MNAKNILMVQPSLQPPGGGYGVGAWILEALKDHHRLSLLTWRPVDLPVINDHYGTCLKESDMTFISAGNPILKRLLDALPVSASLLKFALLLRACKKMACNYDLVITANNEADFGVPGIQYIHFPWNYFPRPEVDIRWYHPAFLVRLYYRMCEAVADFSVARMTANVTLVNSNWTAARVKARYGDINTRTLYPPAAGDFPDVPIQKRENGFVCLGRIAPEKEFGKIIRIIQRVREKGFGVHLHIIGSPGDPRTQSEITRKAKANPSWIFLDQDLSREALAGLMAQHRYGIHGMKDEHFGMAVAEMVSAGCIVFLPDSGGQTEIIGDADALYYRSEAEAAGKIMRVLKDETLQSDMRVHLASRKDRFSTENFVRQIRNVVAGC